MKYRSAVSITLAILETIYLNGGANISQLSIQANVPHSRLRVRLGELTEEGIITEKKSRRSYSKTYHLTEKGLKSYRRLNELVPFLSSLGLIRKE